MSLTVFTQRNFVADFLQAKCALHGKRPFCVFGPPLGSLWVTYDVYLRLVGNRVVDCLFVLSEFFARCYGWGATSEYRLKICDFAPTWSVDPKFQVEGVAATNHSSSHKTRVNDLWCNIRTWAQLSFVMSQVTCLTDRRTDRQTDRQLSHSWFALAFYASR